MGKTKANNTPLLTVRCPRDILDSIEKTMKETGQNKTSIVIDMLSNSVPSLPIMERAKLPHISAIYFVITPSNKLLYIGQTKNLFNRWLQHHRYQQFIEAGQNTRVAWFEFDESDRDSMPEVENELITLLDSRYNGTDVARTDGKGQLNLSVDDWAGVVFKKACEDEGISLARGFHKIAKILQDNNFKFTGAIAANNSQIDTIVNRRNNYKNFSHHFFV